MKIRLRCKYYSWVKVSLSFNLCVVKADILVIQLFVDHRSSCLEEEELNLFIDVDCMHAEAIMTPMPEGLSQQQVIGFSKPGLLPLFLLPLLCISSSQVPSSSNILAYNII